MANRRGTHLGWRTAFVRAFVCLPFFGLLFEIASITLRGDTFPVTVPSGAESGLKVEPIDNVPFAVPSQDRVAARIVLDPFAQLIRNKGQGFKLKPVLEAEHVSLAELSPILL